MTTVMQTKNRGPSTNKEKWHIPYKEIVSRLIIHTLDETLTQYIQSTEVKSLSAKNYISAKLFFNAKAEMVIFK